MLRPCYPTIKLTETIYGFAVYLVHFHGFDFLTSKKYLKSKMS